jgi:ATP-dependent Lon protease
MNLSQALPVLPLRDVVVYPHMVIPLFVGRQRSVKALESAMTADKQIVLLAQKSADIDEPGPDQLYRVGTAATVLQMLKLPDGTIKVLVEGVERVRVTALAEVDGITLAELAPLALGAMVDERELEVSVRSLVSIFEQYVKLNRKTPPELLTTLSGIDDPSRLADTVAAHLTVKLEEKQQVLELIDLKARLEKLIGLIEGEIELLQIEKRIRGRVKNQMEKSQREYYLNEQMKAIQKELGDSEDAPNEIEELAKRIEAAGMPDAVKTKAKAEHAKLKQMSPMAAEATVVRNYLEWLLNMPWQTRSKVRSDLAEAESVLNEDHFGLEKVKERIVEYLAVQQRVKAMKGPILCLVGPPGVGKTSLGQSIARATNRQFVRMSLGGVRDEAEIRGHRRTYIGSMPGRIVQNLAKAKSRNPLFMLDELDKMSMDFRGDPSSALLEVLDPEQNHAFNDHYLEVDVDLSEVMFLATANSLKIPAPLLDRMEVIRIPGYTEGEKLAIAERYLIPKQLKANGLKARELNVDPEALRTIVRLYTRESGVRNLEREIAKICRKTVKQLTLKQKRKSITIGVDSLREFLGVEKHRYGIAEQSDEIGLVTGLAWTEVGGELLSIEATILPGKGKLAHTGQLGDVMQESIQAAWSVVRARSQKLGLQKDFYQSIDAHIHVPEGATPKDGPSAGIGMCTAMISALTRIPVRADVAMTGEITLRGRVLPIGGLKEKLLAAQRGGIRTVLIPDENLRDISEVPESIRAGLEIRPVKWIDEVLAIALRSLPTALPEPAVATALEPTVEPTDLPRAH